MDFVHFLTNVISPKKTLLSLYSCNLSFSASHVISYCLISLTLLLCVLELDSTISSVSSVLEKITLSINQFHNFYPTQNGKKKLHFDSGEILV